MQMSGCPKDQSPASPAAFWTLSFWSLCSPCPYLFLLPWKLFLPRAAPILFIISRPGLAFPSCHVP